MDKTKSGKGAVKNAEIQQMAKELLGMVATVDNEREHLRQVGEAYAKLAGENVDLLGKDTAGGSKVSFKAIGRTIMGAECRQANERRPEPRRRGGGGASPCVADDRHQRPRAGGADERGRAGAVRVK